MGSWRKQYWPSFETFLTHSYFRRRHVSPISRKRQTLRGSRFTSTGNFDTDTRRNHQYPETRSLSYRRNSAIRRTSICDDRIGWCRGKHFRVEQLWTATLPCRPDEVRFGVESEIETHPIESQSGESVDIKSPTKELLLLQKAEAFLLRRIVKARDAYDIHVLLQKGAVLNPNLKAHLEDAMHANEIDGETVSERIALIDIDRCSLELKPILPPEIYTPLEESEFEKLRDAVKKLFE